MKNTTVQISNENRRRLLQLQGQIMAGDGSAATVDDALTHLFNKWDELVNTVDSAYAPSQSLLRPEDDLVHDYYNRVLNILKG